MGGTWGGTSGAGPRTDPVSPTDGDVWYNSVLGKFRGREAGASVDLIGGGFAVVWTSQGSTLQTGAIEIRETVTHRLELGSKARVEVDVMLNGTLVIGSAAIDAVESFCRIRQYQN